MTAFVTVPGCLRSKLRTGVRFLSLPVRLVAEVLWTVGRIRKTSVPVDGRKLVDTAMREAVTKKFFSNQLLHSKGGLRSKQRIAMI